MPTSASSTVPVRRRCRPLALAALALLATGLAACSSSGGTAATSAPAPTPAVTPAGPATTVSCGFASAPPAARKVAIPGAHPHTASTLTLQLTVGTRTGTVRIALDPQAAPCTDAAIAHLADAGFYDHTHCHRLVTAGIFVVQCGDPTGTGAGGPGFTIPDEATGNESYPAGTVAMARTQLPHSGGSQFFVVYADSPALQQNLGAQQYTVFGHVTSGLPLFLAAAKAGSDDSNGPGDGAPKLPVRIDSAVAR